MKDTFRVMLVVVLICGTAYAQEESRITDMGVKLGMGLSTLNVTALGLKSAAGKAFNGPVVGLFVTYSLNPRLSLQPELLFVGKGAGGDFMASQRWRNSYLELPILLKYELTDKNRSLPSIYIGPAISYLLSSKYTPAILSQTIDTEIAAQKTDFSIVFGGSLTHRKFILDVRYTMGMVNIYDHEAWNLLVNATTLADHDFMAENDTMKNRSISFALAYRI